MYVSFGDNPSLEIKDFFDIYQKSLIEYGMKGLFIRKYVRVKMVIF